MDTIELTVFLLVILQVFLYKLPMKFNLLFHIPVLP